MLSLTEIEVIDRVAKRAVPFYTGNNWKWWDAGVPNEQEISKVITRLAVSLIKEGLEACSTGGIVVQSTKNDEDYDESLRFRVFLEP